MYLHFEIAPRKNQMIDDVLETSQHTQVDVYYTWLKIKRLTFVVFTQETSLIEYHLLK